MQPLLCNTYHLLLDTDLRLYKQYKDQESGPHIICFTCIFIIFSENTYKTKMF